MSLVYRQTHFSSLRHPCKGGPTQIVFTLLLSEHSLFSFLLNYCVIRSMFYCTNNPLMNYDNNKLSDVSSLVTNNKLCR